MSGKTTTYGFGFDPAEAQNHFYVVIPEKNSGSMIQVYERFAWTPEVQAEEPVAANSNEPVYANGQKLAKSDVLRIEISRHKWSLVAKDITAEFNTRLRDEKKATGKFVIGGTPVEKLFGKEMMVLLWGIEDCDPSNIPTAIKNWKGLMPEERWWLYTTTNASTGGLNDQRGWRMALRYALCENPIIRPEEQLQIDSFSDMEG